MKNVTYNTEGTCSKQIQFVLADDGTIDNVEFLGGCHGNLQGIAALVKGRRPEEVIATLKGIRCRDKATSCPDQLARALEQAM
ncbi:MAG: TIGR03905 family TSCPD domain-containing protein [Muribaculaceae bacterium]|nr:TIGR03905 family TSCPD domain-containing protein [Muribaculaceae bacterium]MDE7370086.1 TIGR03905 family TSCPD domain-containing protein [Muribaculaceae bacterium]